MRPPAARQRHTRPAAPARRPVVALLVLVLLVLTGCATALPTDPVPRAGLSVAVQPNPDVQRFLQPPQPGAAPAEIVEGFLRANVGFADDDDVARTFLTPALASEWVPTESVLVLDGTRTYGPDAGDTVTVSATVRGHIDASGVLTERTGEATQTFSVARVDGEWRIDAFPEGFGLWLNVPDLERAFRDTPIYYLDPHLGYFVPEVRWLARGEGLTTAVARTQLAPVPPYLQGAVRTGASPDVHLAVGAVPVDPTSQVATVNLQGQGLGEDRQRILDLRAQLGHALLGLSGVSAVELHVGGRNLLQDGEGAVNVASDLGFTDVQRDVERALLRVGEVFALVDPQRVDLRNLPSSTGSVDLPRLDLSWTGVATTAELDDLAAVSTDRTRLWTWSNGAEHVNEGIGDALTDPSFDPHGALWVAGVARSQGTARVWVVEGGDLTAVARPIDVPWLEGDQRITTFRVAPDGTRALLVVGEAGDETRQRLLVSGIVRDSQGRPTGLAQPMTAAPALVSVGSARWAATTEIVATGRRVQDQRTTPFRVPLGGWLQELGDAEAGLVDVLPVPTGQTYAPVAQTEDGRFHTREGSSGWFGARNGDELIIPGT